MVYRSEGFAVVSGANIGDPIFQAQEAELSDVYRLKPSAQIQHLTIAFDEVHLSLAPQTGVGHAGATLYLDCVATFIGNAGGTVEVLVFVETDADGMIEGSYLMPFTPLSHEMDYTLVAVDTKNARKRLNDIACIAFCRSTRITMANGMQKAVEKLVPGDRVLTRGHGSQEVRWIGQHTVRAQGAGADRSRQFARL